MSNTVRTQVRIPEKVWSWVKDSGKKNERSANGELVKVLTDLMERQGERKTA